MLCPKWLTIHGVAVGLVVLFVELGIWQMHRAEGGNTASYGYALEWPTFALMVIGFWVRIVRAELRDGFGAAPGGSPAAASGDGSDTEDPAASASDEEAVELAAYNRYVAQRARARSAG
jgi:hypothetical protein